MNISKDEARILADALDDYKHTLANDADSKEEALKIITAFDHLKMKLHRSSGDMRRIGRRSQDSYSDCVKRFVKKYVK